MPPPSIVVYVKRVHPSGPNAGTISLTPGDWVTAGTWVAMEPGGGKFFGERRGTFSVKNAVATLKGESGARAIELMSFEPTNPPAGPGTIFETGEGEGPLPIAWRATRPWD